MDTEARGPGRPPLADATVTRSLVMPVGMHARLEALAEARGVKASEAMRLAIGRGLEALEGEAGSRQR